MITMHPRSRPTDGKTDGRTNIMATVRRFGLTNASRTKNMAYMLSLILFIIYTASHLRIPTTHAAKPVQAVTGSVLFTERERVEV